MERFPVISWFRRVNLSNNLFPPKCIEIVHTEDPIVNGYEVNGKLASDKRGRGRGRSKLRTGENMSSDKSSVSRNRFKRRNPTKNLPRVLTSLQGTEYEEKFRFEDCFKLGVYQCPKENCQKELKTIRGLRYHLMAHSGKLNYICYLCGKKFVTNGKLKIHSVVHEDRRPFKCECGASFKTKYLLYQHDASHQPKYNCYYCGKSFSRKCALIRHISRITCCFRQFECRGVHAKHEKEPGHSVSCATCLKQFAHLDLLKWHRVFVHHDNVKDAEDIVECLGKCNRFFNSLASMKRHLRSVHRMATGARPNRIYKRTRTEITNC